MLSKTNLKDLRQDVESHSLWERPSIYYSKDLKIGDKINSDSLIIRRPSLGLNPIYFEKLIGKEIKSNVTKYQPVSIQHFSN